jgi:hypothetical protein
MGFFGSATFSFWLAEAIANGTFFMGTGFIFIALGALPRVR